MQRIQAKVELFIIGSNDLANCKEHKQCLVDLDAIIAITMRRMGDDTHIVLSEVVVNYCLRHSCGKIDG